VAAQYMHQVIDDVDTWIEVADTAVSAHVMAGWAPCDPPEVVTVPLADLPRGKPAEPVVVPVAPPGEADLAFAAEQAALEQADTEHDSASEPAPDPSVPAVRSAPKES
jgi:hypothetical protein